jgi:hypothetical protein
MRPLIANKTALMAGVAASGLAASVQAMEGYEIDRLFSYSVGELRIRPQLDVSFLFNDNVFFAPEESEIYYVDPRQPAFAVSENNGQYIYNPGGGIPNAQYQGALQFQVYRDSTLTQLVNASPVFTSGTYPAVTVPFNPTQTAFLAGFRTNVLSLQPRVADVIGTVSPGIKIQYGSDELNFVGVEYNLDSARYLDQGIAPSPMHRIRAQLRFERSRLKLEASQTASFVSSFLGGGANQGRRLVDRWTGVTDSKLTYDSTAKTDVYTSLQYSFTEYQTLVGLYSPNTWRANLGATYKPTERIFLFTEGHYLQTALTPSAPNLPGAPYSQAYGGFIGVRGNFTQKITGSIRGGYEIREFPNVQTDNSFGIPAADISITYLPRETTQISLTYSRRSDVSSQVAQQTVGSDTIRLGVRQAIGVSAKWVASAEVSYNLNEFGKLVFQQANVLDFLPGTDLRYKNVREANFQRSESLFGISAGISYSPRSWLRTTLSYEFENYGNTFADSGFNDFFLPSYNAHRVMLALQIGY